MRSAPRKKQLWLGNFNYPSVQDCFKSKVWLNYGMGHTGFPTPFSKTSVCYWVTEIWRERVRREDKYFKVKIIITMYLLRTYYIQGSVLCLLSYFTCGMGFTYWIVQAKKVRLIRLRSFLSSISFYLLNQDFDQSREDIKGLDWKRDREERCQRSTPCPRPRSEVAVSLTADKQLYTVLLLHSTLFITFCFSLFFFFLFILSLMILISKIIVKHSSQL